MSIRSGSASTATATAARASPFISTQSKLFAAVGMGAGVTDLFSDFSQNGGWSYQVTGGSGANGSNDKVAVPLKWLTEGVPYLNRNANRHPVGD